MAPDNNGFYEVNLEFPNNTGPMLEGLEKISGVVKDSRDDIKAFNDALTDTIGKASQIKDFFSGSVDEVEKMKSLLEITSTIIQGNQSLLSNNLTAINEIISSVKGMGGNIGQAMSVLGLAGAPIQNIMSGAAPTASQDFSYMDNTAGNIFERGTMQVPELPEFLGRKKVRANEDVLNEGQVAGPPIGDGVAKTPAGNKLRQILERDYPTLAKHVPEGAEGRAAEYAYGTMQNRLDTALGRRGLGGYLNRHFTGILSATGINQKSIRDAQRANLEPVTEIGPGGAVIFKKYPAGHPREGQLMYQPKAEFGDTEAKTMATVDKILGHMETGIGASVMKYAGYLNVATIAYNMLHDVTKFIRPLAQYAQQQGQLMGQVNYAGTAGNTLKDFFQSGFDLNPFYSFADVTASRNNALALGFRGNNVDQYMAIASQFQQQYGLNQQQTMQMVGGGLAFGVNQNTIASTYGSVANLINNSQTSSKYGQAAYMQGMQQAAAYGANSAAAAQIGITSAQFGANNFVAQAAGMTGNELMGTQLGTALMAQQLGTSYLGVYAAEQNMTGSAIQAASDESIITLLSNSFGINNQTIKKQSDLNQYATLLSMILPQLGVDPKKVGTPKQAATWVWSLLQRYKHETNKKTTRDLNKLNKVRSVVSSLNNSQFNAGRGGDLSYYMQQYQQKPLETTYNKDMGGSTTVQIALHPSVQHVLTTLFSNQKHNATNGSQPVNTLGK